MKALMTAALLCIPVTSAAAVTAPAPFHGIEVNTEVHTPFVMVMVTYEGSIPAAGVDVLIYAPGEEGLFQSGTTDPDGRFAFLPKTAGTWRIEADDGAGHRRSHEVAVDAGLAAEAGSEEPGETEHMHEEETDHVHEASLPLWMRVTWGLSLIAGIAGLAYGVTARRGSTSGD